MDARLADLEGKLKTIEDRARERNWVSILQLVVSIAGFLLVITSVRQAAETLERSVYSNATDWVLGLDRVFIERPHLRPYFYNGEAIAPGHDDFDEAVAMAELVADTLEAVWEQRFASRGKQPIEGWENWMMEMVDQSPLLRRHLSDHRSWYEEGGFYQRIYLQSKPHSEDPSP
jgi:hypothetical protein